MKTKQSARTEILERLRAVSITVPLTEYSPLTSNKDYFVQPETNNLAQIFAERLRALSGNCQLCSSLPDALVQIQKLISDNTVYCTQKDLQSMCAEHGITSSDSEDFAEHCLFSLTTCDALAARTASVIISSATLNGRKAIAAPETHIVLAYQSQLFVDLPEAFASIHIDSLPSQITTITGPSRTADIEKTLVLGAHGPKQLYVFIIPDNE